MKKLVSLLLALALVLTAMVGFGTAMADDEKHVSISVINTLEDYHPKNMADDLSPELQIWYDGLQHLLPGYIIDLEMMTYDDEFAQLPLLLAAGDTPDITTCSKTQFMEYMDTGLFIEDLTELLNEYGQDILAGTTAENMAVCTIGGKIRAIPTENYSYKFPTTIRADWLDKLGVAYEADGITYFTLSELKDILTRMTTEDPDGNGAADTYGLGTRYNGGDWTQTFMPILGAFGGQAHQNYIVDGVCTPFDVSAEFRAALEYLRDLYAVGAIDKECFILNYDQALLNAANGKGGMYSGWWNVAGNICDAGLLDNDENARLAFIRVTSDDGTLTGVLNNGSIWKTHMISAECEHPEAAMAIMNYQEGIGRNAGNGPVLDADGHFTYEEGAAKTAKTRVYEVCNYSALYDTQDEQYANGWRQNPLSNLFISMANRQAETERNDYAREVEEPVVYEDWKMELREKWNHQGDLMQANLDGHKMYQNVFYGYVSTPEFLEYNANLESCMKEWVVNFVTGAVALDDAGWAQYMADYTAKGGQKVLDSMLAEYNEMNGTDVVAFQIVG